MNKIIKAKDMAIALVLLFLLIGYISEKSIFLRIAAGFAVVSLVWTAPFIWLSKLWFGMAQVMGTIIGRIILSIIFFLVLTPLSFFYRLTHGNFLFLKNDRDTLFKERNHKFTPEEFSTLF